MSNEQVVIRQISNPDNPEIGIKYVNAKEYLTIKVGPDGKNITGVDENALEILQLPADEKSKKSKEVKKIRESLEVALGKDLTPDSNFWTEFILILEDGFILDPTNPMDQLVERVLIANRYVAPSEEDITSDERFHRTLFYFYREAEVVAKSAKKNQEKDKALARLYSLHEENPGKLKMVAAYIFGFDADIELSIESAYEKLRDFITNDKEDSQERNIKQFLAGVAKTPEEIAVKQILDKAVKQKIVSSKGGKYKRGDEHYGDTYEDAISYLQLPENSGELAYLRKTIEK
jgi:hypothetical protein